MAEPNVKERDAATVKVDGEEAVMHITDQSVMFEKGGKVSGFLRSAIQMVKADGDSMLIAYAVGSEVKSVRVVPITAVTPLLVPGFHSGSGSGAGQVPASATALDEVFEKLYWGTRKELEERLARVQEEPANKSLRLTPHEEQRYGRIRKQMTDIVGAKYGFDHRAPGNSLSFFGLEKESYERQLDTIKTLHTEFLQYLVSPRAEIADIGYTTEDVWPDDWERVLVRFKLANGQFLKEKFKSYLKSKWTHPRGNRTPVLARA